MLLKHTSWQLKLNAFETHKLTIKIKCFWNTQAYNYSGSVKLHQDLNLFKILHKPSFSVLKPYIVTHFNTTHAPLYVLKSLITSHGKPQ